METYHLTISKTQKGTPWDKTLIKELDFKSDDPYKDGAEIICKIAKEESLDYPNGMYFRICEPSGHSINFLSVNTQDKFTNERSSYIRFAGGGLWDCSADCSEKKKYLVCLDEQTNDYKSYTMYQEEDNERFGVSYGRIGGVSAFQSNYDFDKEGAHYYPAEMFWFKYYEKINKGYLDRSEIKDFEFSRGGKIISSDKEPEQKIPQELEKYESIEDKDTKELIEFLISRQREYVQQNYNYSRHGAELNTEFNQKAIDMAEDLLNQMSVVSQTMGSAAAHGQLKENQQKIISLYKDLMLTLPRRVNNVSDYIKRIDFTDKDSDDYIDKVLENERDLLDNLKDICIADNLIDKPAETVKKKGTILDEYGLTAVTADFENKFDVLEKMGDDAFKVSKVISVCNKRTDAAYKACKKEMGIHDGGCHLFWHGSRTENWWSIFKNGMSLNPNAVVTGKMFGQGLYFAPLAHKSLGYVDMRGSYWAHGSQKTGYLGLYEVAMGKPYEVDSAISNSFSFKDLRHGCHSVWAKAGKHLYNDECIVYREDQCNIKYLVEVDCDRQKQYSFDIHKVRNLHLTNLRYTQVDENTHYINCSIPNFRTCTGLPVKNVTAEYNIENDSLEIQLSSVSSALINSADNELLKEIFKSKFAENNKKFKETCEEIIAYGEIPSNLSKDIEKKYKERNQLAKG